MPVGFHRALTPEDILSASGFGGVDPTPNDSFVFQGDPAETEARIEAQRERNDFLELVARQEQLDRRGPHMNPRAYAQAAAGLEYDLSQFQESTRVAFEDRRKLRRATKDAEAATLAYQNGEIDDRQLAQVMDSMSRQYGDNTLVHVPAWRQLAGAEEEFQAKKQALIKAQADQWGVPEDFLRWDDNAGAPTVDTERIAIEKVKREAELVAQKPVIEAQKTQRELAATLYKQNITKAQEALQANLKLKVHPTQAFQIFDDTTAGAFRQYEEMIGMSGAATQMTQAPAATAPGPQKLPNGVQLAGSFTTPASMKSSNLPNGSYAQGGPFLFRKDNQGIWREVD